MNMSNYTEEELSNLVDTHQEVLKEALNEFRAKCITYTMTVELAAKAVVVLTFAEELLKRIPDDAPEYKRMRIQRHIAYLEGVRGMANAAGSYLPF